MLGRMVADTSPAAALQAWVSAHPRYAYIVEASERSDDGAQTPATLRVTVDATKNTEDVHVVRGPGAGSDIHWNGSDTVNVRGPGIAHMLSMRVNVRDARILSPRGNDIRSAIFARVARCYTAASDVHSALADGQTVLTLNGARAAACGPEYGEAGITSDRVTLDAGDGHPLLRERLAGSTVVERWVIHDLHVPPG